MPASHFRLRRAAELLAAAILLLPAPSLALIVLDDGQVHLASGLTPLPVNDVEVRDAAGGATTTLIVDFGLARVDAFGSSVIEVTPAGEIDTAGVRTNDQAFVLIEGEVAGFQLRGDSTGIVRANARFGGSLFDAAHLRVEGGGFENLFLDDMATAEIAGGFVGIGVFIQLLGTSFLEVSGGTISAEVSAGENSSILWRGGSFGASVEVRDNGELDINCFSDTSDCGLEASGDGVIRVSGSGFTVDDVPVGPGDLAALSGLLRGTLDDGTEFVVPFERFGNGVITLVPEPGTVFLFGLGLTLLAARRRA